MAVPPGDDRASNDQAQSHADMTSGHIDAEHGPLALAAEIVAEQGIGGRDGRGFADADAHACRGHLPEGRGEARQRGHARPDDSPDTYEPATNPDPDEPTARQAEQDKTKKRKNGWV